MKPRDLQQRLSSLANYARRPYPAREFIASRLQQLIEDVGSPLKMAAHEKRAAMAESEFWSIVDPIGWGTKTQDYKAVKKQLMKTMDVGVAEAFDATFRKLKSMLDKKLAKIVTNLGDDSYGDLLAHIVGMGQREFNAVMAKPRLGVERANKGAFRESFDYAVPHPSDYQRLDLRPHLTWAQNIIEAYEKVLNASEKQVPGKSKVVASLKTVVMNMKLFLKDKSPQELLQHKDEIKKAAEVAEQGLRPLGYGGSLPDPGTLEQAIKEVSNKWFVWNMLSDVEQFLA